jgi:hypothetical protein
MLLNGDTEINSEIQSVRGDLAVVMHNQLH